MIKLKHLKNITEKAMRERNTFVFEVKIMYRNGERTVLQRATSANQAIVAVRRQQQEQIQKFAQFLATQITF